MAIRSGPAAGAYAIDGEIAWLLRGRVVAAAMGSYLLVGGGSVAAKVSALGATPILGRSAMGGQIVGRQDFDEI